MTNFTIKTRKVMTNALLGRRQMVLDVYHPETATVQKEDLRAALVEKLKVDDANKVFVFGFKTAYGGLKSTGFATVYNTMEAAYSAEPRHRLVKNSLIGKVSRTSRKVRKDIKNKRSRLPGLQKERGKRKRASADDE